MLAKMKGWTLFQQIVIIKSLNGFGFSLFCVSKYDLNIVMMLEQSKRKERQVCNILSTFPAAEWRRQNNPDSKRFRFYP